MGLRPKPPASACGGPFAPRRSRRAAPCAAWGCAPYSRRPLAGGASPGAAPAEARCARLAESASFYGADSSADRLHLDLLDEEGPGAVDPQSEAARRQVVRVSVRQQLAVHVAPEVPVAAEQAQEEPA